MPKEKDYQIVRLGRIAHQTLKRYCDKKGRYMNRLLDEAVVEKVQREMAKDAKAT